MPDRIISLSDDLLHGILLRLGSTPKAASTSVLSRRWHRVLADLPEARAHLLLWHKSPWLSELVSRSIDVALATCSGNRMAQDVRC